MTERAEHTAGPWFVTRNRVVGPRSDADDQSFGMVIGVCDVYGDNADADSRLIAACPDLLAALKRLRLLSFGTYSAEDDALNAFLEGHDKEVLLMVDAAISKATGEA